MSVNCSLRPFRVLFAFACVLSFGGNLARGQSVPFNVGFWYPTNGESYLAPATVGLHAQVTDSNVVQTMQYFSGATSIGTVTNTKGLLLTNTSADSPFYLAWPNVLAGKYTLTAVATDSTGNTATSAPVTINVTNAPPPPRVPFVVTLLYPTNTESYQAPATIGLYSHVTDSNLVRTVQFFSGVNSIGFATNTQTVPPANPTTQTPFYLVWSNVPAGNFTLIAVATDSAGNTATSAPVTISVTNAPPPPPIPFVVSFWYPSNGQSYLAPAAVWLHAQVTDSNVIQTVQFFSGATSLGTVTNTKGLLLTNTSTESPFYVEWTNVPAGKYTLTAVATDRTGNTATSAPITITVTNAPPPVLRPVVYIYSPTNGAIYHVPTNLTLYARAVENNGGLATVEFFSGNTSLGVVSNGSQMVFTNVSSEPLFSLVWSNVPVGACALHAVATDTNRNTATSSVVNISVITNPPTPVVPFVVGFWYPTNGESYLAPATIGLHAQASDSNIIQTVQYFSGTASIGIVTNTKGVPLTNTSADSPFYLAWSNVLAGNYSLTVVATDSAGNTATSAPVNISVTNVPPPPPVPFVVTLLYPTNMESYRAPATIELYSHVTDSNLVRTVQFFAGANSIGFATNTQTVPPANPSTPIPFYLVWSNVPAGNFTLTAVAIDSAGNTATSTPVNISVTNAPPPPPVPFVISFYYPTNGESFLAPATVGVHASVTDSNVVQTVQYFSGASSLGTVTNTKGVLLTNTTAANPFFLAWSNVLAGNYSLTAVATDSAGNSATSAPVTISVTNAPPPPPVPFVLTLLYPAAGESYVAPATVSLYARVTDSNVVQTVQYFSGATSLGIVTNTKGALLTNTSTSSPFYLAWSNVPAGNYSLTAVATDSAGSTATSAPVTISVTNAPPPPPVPFVVGFYYPTNGEYYLAPATVGVHALVTDSNVVQTVQYFSGSTSLGIVTNTKGVLLTNTTAANPFFLAWSNVPAGNYSLTAVATDSAGNTATSAPLNIYVLSNLPPAVTIYAPDPVAVESTTATNWTPPPGVPTNYFSGSNTATFLVLRDSQTNTDLTVYYSIGGTASNGVDYATIPNNVTIPAGQRYSLITIAPLSDEDSAYRYYDTVLLALAAPSNSPPSYRLGSMSKAGAVILEENLLPILLPTVQWMPDHSVHVSLPAPNGMNYSVQTSSDLVNWQSVCTNTVLKGSAQYVDPDGAANPNLFYRIVPTGPPNY